MSRFHYWQFLLNKEGQPIPDANISVYLAGTEISANVYFDEFGSNYSNTPPQIITNNMGYFEFWIGDASEEFGYSKGQKFKIEWEKPGVALGQIDWIDIFPHVIEVDETDKFSNTKDKLISNKLAYRWEQHRNHTIQDNGFPIHGIEQFNELDDNSISNKVISNLMGKKWNDHVNYSLSTPPISALNTPHGLLPVDGTINDNVFNKLVNNKILYDINSNFTSIYDNLNSINDKIIEMGNAGNIFLPHALSDTWTLTHNFGVKYVSVTVYGDDDKEIIPKEIILTDFNTVTVILDYPISGYAVITGNTIQGGPDIPPFIIEGDHGSLTGLLSDDHTQYILVDGTRNFTGPITGITPIEPSHLATKEYVDNVELSHAKILNSSYGDDHAQYVHIDSRRGFRNPIVGQYPIESNHLATKEYVDNHIFSHSTLVNVENDDHLQYVHIDGRRSFTHTISGIRPTEPSHLATKEYVDDKLTDMGNAGNIFLPHALSDTWTLTHNFGVKYVSVTVYGDDDKEIIPKEIILTDFNTVTVILDYPISGYAVITGNTIQGGPDIPPFIIEGDHGSLTGLLSDDHIQYILVDGTRGFINPVKGIDPIANDDLATKYYVDNIELPHSKIINSSYGDDHTQYILVNGNRGFTGTIAGITPVSPMHLTTKEYVDSKITQINEYIDSELFDISEYIDNELFDINQVVSNWETMTASFNAVVRKKYIVDTSISEIIVTLPLTANNGESIRFTDGANFSINKITVNRNGNKIGGLEEDLIVDTSNQSFELVFYNNNWLLA